MLTHKKGTAAVENLGEFLSIDPASLRSVVQAVKNVMQDPESRALILEKFKGENGAKELNEEAVATMLREALSVTAELHKNEYNIQRISQMISLMSKKNENEENKAAFLAEYWEKAEAARQRAENKGQTSAKAQPDAILTPKEPQKIAFKDKPEVNLGAAIVSVGLGKWISNVLSRKTKDAEGKEHPPSGWKKAAKWLVILGLTAVTGAALWRAGTLQRSDGTSWAERAFDPKLAESVRSR